MSDDDVDDEFTTASPEPEAGEVEIDEAQTDGEGAQALERLFAADGPADFDEGMFAGPLYWPAVPSADVERELGDLRAWVEQLLDRFDHLDYAVIPACWWRHGGHIEALQALRDHERMSYADSSPAQAAASWHREFHFIEMRLREWTGQIGCGKDHRAPVRSTRLVDEDEWERMVTEETRRRHLREITG
jgi:hypothetical protein